MLPLGILMFLASLIILLDNEFEYILFGNAIAYADTHVVQAGCSADKELPERAATIFLDITVHTRNRGATRSYNSLKH